MKHIYLAFCFLMFLVPKLSFSQSKEISIKDLEYLMKVDTLVTDDFLFLRNYVFTGDMPFYDSKIVIYEKGQFVRDYSDLRFLKNEKGFKSSITYSSYSEISFNGTRKFVVENGFKRLPDKYGFLSYENSSYEIDFTETKDKDGNLRYAVNLSSKTIKNPIEVEQLKRKSNSIKN